MDNISFSPVDIKVGNPVEITINFKENDAISTNSQAATSILGAGVKNNSQAQVNLPCAVLVNYGDGRSEQVRVDADSPSLKIIHTYATEGSYPLSAEGKVQIRGIKSVLGCSGNTQNVTLNVVNEETAKKSEGSNLQVTSNTPTQLSKIETKGLSVNELLKRGFAAYQAKQYEDAEILISAGLKAKPRDANANLYLGLALKELNQKERAIKALKTSIKLGLSSDNSQMAKQALIDINTIRNQIYIEATHAEVSEIQIYILDEPKKNNTSEQLASINNLPPQYISFNQLNSLVKDNQKYKTNNRALIIDYLPPVIYEKVSITGTKKGKKVTRSQEEHNPAWDNANQRVIDAQNEFNKTKSEIDKSNAQQYVQGSANKAIDALALIFKGVATYATSDKLLEAKNNLASTPQTISKPIYADYSYPIVKRDIKRVDKVIAYLVDFNKAIAYQREFKKTDSVSITAEQSNQNSDSSASAQAEFKQTMIKVDALKDINHQSIELKQVIDETSSDSNAIKPIGSLVNLPNKISKRHAIGLNESKKALTESMDSAANLEKKVSALNNNQQEVKNMKSDSSSKTINNKVGSTNIQKLAGNASSNCLENFNSLVAKYPNFSSPQLEQAKASITSQSVIVIINQLKSSGYSADTAIDVATKQADEYKRAYKEALSCASSVDGYGNDEKDFIEYIKNNNYGNLSCEGIRNNCLCAAITFHMGYLQYKSLSAAILCNKRQGTY